MRDSDKHIFFFLLICFHPFGGLIDTLCEGSVTSVLEEEGGAMLLLL